MSNTREQPSDTEPTAIGVVELDVVDLDRSVEWWSELVGLRVQSADSHSASLGANGTPLVVLRSGASISVRSGYAGLYHLAIYLPDEPALAHLLARLIARRERFSATDHLVAKSLYVMDPDGIGLELTIETPERVRSVSWPESERTPKVIDAEGRLRTGLEPLDLEAMLAVVPDADPSAPIAPGTTMGHVHLAVSDLADAYTFYRDRLAFAPINYAPLAGYGDLGRRDSLNHLIAVNTWRTAGAPPHPAGMAGMSRFTVCYASHERLREVAAKLEQVEEDSGVFLSRDPVGNTVALAAPAKLPV